MDSSGLLSGSNSYREEGAATTEDNQDGGTEGNVSNWNNTYWNPDLHELLYDTWIDLRDNYRGTSTEEATEDFDQAATNSIRSSCSFTTEDDDDETPTTSTAFHSGVTFTPAAARDCEPSGFPEDQNTSATATEYYCVDEQDFDDLSGVIYDFSNVEISEESQICVNAINDTLMSQYRLNFHPPLAEEPLMFWTEQEYAVVKEFVRQYPFVYPNIIKLRLAEDVDLNYSKEKHDELEEEYKNASLKISPNPRHEEFTTKEVEDVSNQQFRSRPDVNAEIKLTPPRQQISLASLPSYFPSVPDRQNNPPATKTNAKNTNYYTCNPAGIKTAIHLRERQDQDHELSGRLQHRLSSEAVSFPQRVQSYYFLNIRQWQRQEHQQNYPQYPHHFWQVHDPYWLLKRLQFRFHQDAVTTIAMFNLMVLRNLRLRRRISYINYLHHQAIQERLYLAELMRSRTNRNSFSSRRRQFKKMIVARRSHNISRMRIVHSSCQETMSSKQAELSTKAKANEVPSEEGLDLDLDNPKVNENLELQEQERVVVLNHISYADGFWQRVSPLSPSYSKAWIGIFVAIAIMIVVRVLS